MAWLFARMALNALSGRDSLLPTTLIETLARSIDTKCQMQIAVLLAACLVVHAQDPEHFLNLDFENIMTHNGLQLDRNRVWRRSVTRYVKIIDVLHSREYLGLRTYEFLLVRSRHITMRTCLCLCSASPPLLIQRAQGGA